MTYDSESHHRKSIRYEGYDYAQEGAYFVTLCAREKQCLFGNIEKGEMKLNDVGYLVRNAWQKLTDRFANIQLDEFVVMPNHFHGIINIIVGAVLVPTHPIEFLPAPINTKTISDMIRAFKSLVTHEYILNVKSGSFPPFKKSLWQRNYYEHIIRNDHDLRQIQEYIINNPLKWELDEFYASILRVLCQAQLEMSYLEFK